MTLSDLQVNSPTARLFNYVFWTVVQ